MSWLKKLYFSHSVLLLALCYLLFRLPLLTKLPMFSDEALYIEWGWREVHIPGQLFHSVYDAKQPFIMWFFGLGQTIFPDPLWGSRIVSIITGFISLLGIYFLGRRLFNQRVANISALLYIVIPFFNFFDRQAMVDSAVVASVIWSFYFLYGTVTSPSLRSSLLLGAVLGLGMFTKNTPVIFLFTAVVIQCLVAVRRHTIIRTLTYLIYTLTVIFIINLPLYLEPVFWTTLNTNSRWTFTLAELLKFPVSQWFQNLIGNLELLFVHFTPPLFLVTILGFWKYFKLRDIKFRLLLLWLIIPASIYLFLERFMNFMIFRYITPFIPLLIFPAALFLSRHPRWLIPVLILPIVFSLLITFNPLAFFQIQARVTRYSYIDGYVTGYDTGYELNEIVKFIRRESQKQPVYVGIAVHSFNPESGIWDYFRKDPRVTVSYFDTRLFDSETFSQIDCVATDRPLYFIAKLNDTAGLDKWLQKLTKITNPYNPDYVTVYTLKSNCPGKTLQLSLGEGINH
jgi:4-amino-4-deoxy-L-arabinose transferase-like glycosyltransferase